MDTRSPQGEWLGDAQFHAILRSTLDECDGVWAAGTLARSIEAQLDAFQAGAPREDDRTFVLVRRGS
jgi:hypothetical protein